MTRPSRRPARRRHAARSTTTTRRPPSWSATACTAASACRPARRTCCGARRWTRPRGRIYLMKAGLDGRAADRRRWSRHFDACLGCMACVTACPSGVQYDRLIEATRAQVERRHRAAASATGCCARRSSRCSRTRGGCGCCAARCAAYQAQPGCSALVRRSGAARPGCSPTLRRHGGAGAAAGAPAPRLPERVAAPRHRAGRWSGMLTGCVQRRVLPRRQRRHRAGAGRWRAATSSSRAARAAAARCSVHNGREARGAWRFARAHDRHLRGGRRRARRRQRGRLRLVDEGVRRAAAPTTRRTPSGPRRSPRTVRDVTELLVELGPGRRRHPLPVTVAYHDACHLAHAQGVRAQPRELLRGIPGLELREIAEAGDLLRLGRHLQPAATRSRPRELGDRKAARRARHRRRAAGHRQPGLPDAGRRGRRAGRAAGSPLAHTVEVLDASLRGRTVEQMTRGLALGRSGGR